MRTKEKFNSMSAAISRKLCIKLLCAGLSLILFGACSSSDDSTDPLEVYKSALQRLYPEAKNVDWEKQSGYYVAEFDNPALRIEMSVWFDASGQWVMKEYDYEDDATAIPPQVTGIIDRNDNYKGYRVTDVHKYEHVNSKYFWLVEYQLPNGQKGRVAGTETSPIYQELGNAYITPDSPTWGTGQPNVHP